MSKSITCEIELGDGGILTTSILSIPREDSSIYILDDTSSLRLYNITRVRLVATEYPYIVISGAFDASEYED